MSSFFQELVRRKVLRVCGVYIGVAWMIIESSSVILPLFDVPEWVFRTIVIAGLAGFPVAFVLAWTFQVTEQGILTDEEALAADAAQPRRGRRADFVVIGVLATALLVSVYLNFVNTAAPPMAAVDREPLPVLIANFANSTGEALFDGTLEEALRIGIEGAPFITSYPRLQAIELAEAIRPGSALDAELARLVAMRQGIKLVFAGEVAGSGQGFLITARAVDAQSGEELLSVDAEAKSRLEVLNAMAALAEDVRRALGDLSVEDSNVLDVFTATNLEAVNAYMQAQRLAGQWRHEDAVPLYEEAIRHDPDMGRAWSGWAYSSWELGQRERAEELWQEMLKRLDTMTQRERLRSLGIYYAHTGNIQKAIENYQGLVDRYPADAAGHNNLAVARFLNREFQQAMQSGRNVLQIYPERTLYLANYALYAMYAGAFEVATTNARKVLDLDPDYYLAWLPLAIDATANGKLDDAASAWVAMASTGPRGSARARLGQADLALVRGAHAAAAELLADGVAAATSAGDTRRQRRLRIWTAEARIAGGERSTDVHSLLEEGTTGARSPALLVPAAMAWIDLGELAAARGIADDLAGRLDRQARAWGQVLQARLALAEDNPLAAVDAAQAALALSDLWLARVVLGQAWLATDRGVEAMSEFETALERRGEGSALFLDDVPTWRHVQQVHYWLGRAREAVGLGSAADAYRAFLAPVDAAADGPLVLDARSRLAALSTS